MIPIKKIPLYGLIAVAILVGFFVGVVLCNYFFLNAPLFHFFMFLLLIIPALVIGFIIFLIILKWKSGKFVTIKGVHRFCILLAIFVIVFYTIFASIHISPTYIGKLGINQLHLSSDGSRLLSVSGHNSIISPETGEEIEWYEAILWNTISGEKIWEFNSSEYFWDIDILPNGIDLIFKGNSSIYSIVDRRFIGECSGIYNSYFADGRYIGTVSRNARYNLTIWNAVNVSKIRTIIFNDSVFRFYISPNGLRVLTFEDINHYTRRISMLDISKENITYLWDKSFNKTNRIDFRSSISWSKNSEKLQLVYYTRGENYKEHYHIVVWNVSDGKLIDDNEESEFIIKDSGQWISHFEFVAIRTPSKIKIYNMSGLMKTIKTECEYGDFDISSDNKIIAIYDCGKLEIKNISSGKLINRLNLPEYELVRGIPGFEFLFFIIALFIIYSLRGKEWL